MNTTYQQATTQEIAIKPQYYQWKGQVERLQTGRAEFEKWLFLHAASVLFGQKAGELLTLTAGQFGLCFDRQLAYLDKAAALWDVAYCVLHQTAVSLKFVVYQPELVQRQFDAVPPCMLQDELAYPANMTPAAFLAEVRRRWLATDAIPHEIGFALGYPVKDVLGYMGLRPLPCSGCCGWQVYGDFATSQRLCHAFTQARQQAIRFLHCPVGREPSAVFREP